MFQFEIVPITFQLWDAGPIAAGCSKKGEGRGAQRKVRDGVLKERSGTGCAKKGE